MRALVCSGMQFLKPFEAPEDEREEDELEEDTTELLPHGRKNMANLFLPANLEPKHPNEPVSKPPIVAKASV